MLIPNMDNVLPSSLDSISFLANKLYAKLSIRPDILSNYYSTIFSKWVCSTLYSIDMLYYWSDLCTNRLLEVDNNVSGISPRGDILD
jgi:hypothetical protein